MEAPRRAIVRVVKAYENGQITGAQMIELSGYVESRIEGRPISRTTDWRRRKALEELGIEIDFSKLADVDQPTTAQGFVDQDGWETDVNGDWVVDSLDAIEEMFPEAAVARRRNIGSVRPISFHNVNCEATGFR